MTAAARTARRCGGRQDGAAAVVLLLLTPALLGLAGLVLDGGTELAARQHAADLAEQAARAGADRLDTGRLRATGTSTLDVTAAQAAACRYVTITDPTARCTATVVPGPDGAELQVRLQTSHPTVLLGLLGINRQYTDAVATATAVTGIRTPFGTGPEAP